ncbi:MAG: RtcB family protein [Actinobacteria bacterium]|nr:RtcB family protein [Actinomycetota bacterium]MBW3645718.1 RtcB family protein [Actinomycetota bacterium]
MPTHINDKLISWASESDDQTILQAQKTARLPIVEGHVALMPDAHVGMGATVGSVIPTKNAVIPAAVGVDIGCGMIAAELDVFDHQLPDSLEPLLGRIEQAIPAGVGQGHDRVADNADRWLAANKPVSDLGTDKATKAAKQFGTLGSGNHFFELCVDERDRVWVVLHSGSRGIGHQLAQAHIAKARNLAKDLELRLEDPDLAYFVEGTPEFQSYIGDMLWAQDYARANRSQMMDNAMREVFAFLGVGRETRRINCHHNFTQREVHHGNELWITRKGAIKADRGDLGVIPGSMGTRSYIVRGKGEPASWTSCSHGAGRRHSRTQAKKLFTTADLAQQMQGKVWLAKRAEALVDEIPSAYKDIDQVMADQSDLVEVLHTLHQVLNYKGT